MSTITRLAVLLTSSFVATSGFGQSSFRFNNYIPPAVDAPVFDAEGVRLEGPYYVAELWGGANIDSLNPARAFYSDQRVIIAFSSGIGSGYVRDTYSGRDPADHPTVLGVPPIVGSAWLQMRAWDTRMGSTYEEVAALGIGGFGESLVFSTSGSNPFDLQAPGAPLIGLESFSLRPVVPEPGVWALLCVGLPFLWWIRRRYS